jgi:hypothetical protein
MKVNRHCSSRIAAHALQLTHCSSRIAAHALQLTHCSSQSSSHVSQYLAHRQSLRSGLREAQSIGMWTPR